MKSDGEGSGRYTDSTRRSRVQCQIARETRFLWPTSTWASTTCNLKTLSHHKLSRRALDQNAAKVRNKLFESVNHVSSLYCIQASFEWAQSTHSTSVRSRAQVSRSSRPGEQTTARTDTSSMYQRYWFDETQCSQISGLPSMYTRRTTAVRNRRRLRNSSHPSVLIIPRWRYLLIH